MSMLIEKRWRTQYQLAYHGELQSLQVVAAKTGLCFFIFRFCRVSSWTQKSEAKIATRTIRNDGSTVDDGIMN